MTLLPKSLSKANSRKFSPFIKKIGEGWDNFVFEINGKFLFRFPKHDVGSALLKNETSILPKIADIATGIQVPKIAFFGRPVEEYPYHFIGVQKTEGSTACSLNLSDTERCNLVETFAHFLKGLHSVPLSAVDAWGLATDNQCRENRIDPSLLKQRILDSQKVMEEHGYLDASAKVGRMLRKLEGVADSRRRCLIHGDLYARHLIVGPNNRLAGIIDWGDSWIEHPAIDCQILFTFFPSDARKTFFDIYGPIDARDLQLSMLRGLMSASTMLSFGLLRHDNDLIKEGVFGLALVCQRGLNTQYTDDKTSH